MEVVYSSFPQPPRGSTLLQQFGTPAVYILFGYIVSDVDCDQPCMFEPVSTSARFRVAKRPPRRIDADESALAARAAKAKVATPKATQKPPPPIDTTADGSAKPKGVRLSGPVQAIVPDSGFWIPGSG